MYSNTIFVFPGQGSQYVGMAKDFYDNMPEAREIFELASNVTGLNVTELCLEGPLEELTRTSNLQPCLTAVEMICAVAMMQHGVSPVAVAGHSLGEYAALWTAGVLDMEDTLRLVHLRGQLMEEAGTQTPGAMAAVIGLNKDSLTTMLLPLQKEGVIALANHNSPEQIVVTGERLLVERLVQQIKAETKAKAIPLKVAGAFHSPLMQEPSKRLAEALKDVHFKPARIPVYCNVTAQPETDPMRIQRLLVEQIYSPVRWYETVVNMASNHSPCCFLELGPKNVLTNLIKKTLAEGTYAVYQIEDSQGIEAFLNDDLQS
jgi:[acyl-carrier-protein] S-malonyltransferase